jgi:hypothetical protein
LMIAARVVIRRSACVVIGPVYRHSETLPTI